MAIAIGDLLRERRLSEEDEKERVLQAVEYWVHGRDKGVTQREAARKYGVKVWQLKYLLQKLEDEALRQEREDKGE